MVFISLVLKIQAQFLKIENKIQFFEKEKKKKIQLILKNEMELILLSMLEK